MGVLLQREACAPLLEKGPHCKEHAAKNKQINSRDVGSRGGDLRLDLGLLVGTDHIASDVFPVG